MGLEEVMVVSSIDFDCHFVRTNLHARKIEMLKRAAVRG